MTSNSPLFADSTPSATQQLNRKIDCLALFLQRWLNKIHLQGRSDLTSNHRLKTTCVVSIVWLQDLSVKNNIDDSFNLEKLRKSDPKWPLHVIEATNWLLTQYFPLKD